MKKLLSLIVVMSFGLLAMAQPPKGPANKGMTFGESTTADGAISVSDLTTTVTSEKETPVKVKGKVTDVCTMEGCWIKVQTSDGKMMVKMKDHAFVVPLDLNGKEVIVNGTAAMKVTSVKELQHYAEDAGKTKEEIAKITEPKKEIILNAKGILVL
ncbi:MAG: DUF4920 domain-containing protein [Chitinophagaceae bacterium]|nr:DUF4920 domain-containing protein [Chitinophagaceae bacterium]